jgi:hypothetical protein
VSGRAVHRLRADCSPLSTVARSEKHHNIDIVSRPSVGIMKKLSTRLTVYTSLINTTCPDIYNHIKVKQKEKEIRKGIIRKKIDNERNKNMVGKTKDKYRNK